MLLPCLLLISQLPIQEPVDLSCGPQYAVNGQLVVRLKPLAEWLGGVVQWSAADKRVTVRRGDTTLQVWVGKGSAQVNGSTVALAATPQIVAGQVVVPLRPVAGAFGARVSLTPAGDAVIVADEGREARIPLPVRLEGAAPGPAPSYSAGYPSDTHRRSAWVTLQQFMLALRDGRTADAESRCTAVFAEDYRLRLFRPLRPLRVERFEIVGWTDANSGRIWIRTQVQVREVTSWRAERWSFRLTPNGDGWQIDAATLR